MYQFYQVGDHVYLTHEGIRCKCLVIAQDGNSYQIAPIDTEPGAWLAWRDAGKLSTRRYERLTVGRRADEEAAYNWRNMEQIQHEARERSWPRPFIACPHCGGNEYEGDHSPVFDFNLHDAGEVTYHCQYPQEIDF